MEFRADNAPEEDEPELVGLRISAGLLAGVGCIFAIYPLGFAVLLIVLAIQVLTGRASIFRPQSWPFSLTQLLWLSCVVRTQHIRSAVKFLESRVFGNLVLGINCISGTAKEPK
jgi:hypothetical protein